MTDFQQRRLAICFALLAPLGHIGNVAAQEANVQPPAVSSDIIQQQKEAAVASIEDETLKQRVSELFDQSLNQLTQIQSHESRLQEFRRAKEIAAERAETARLALGKAPETPTINGTLPLPELEQQLIQAEEKTKKLETSLGELNQQIASRTGRRIEIREQLLELQRKAKDLGEQNTVAVDGEPAAFSLARRTEFLTRRRLTKIETQALETELLAIEAEDVVDLLRLQSDLLMKQQQRASKVFEALKLAVNQRRSDDAQAQVDSTLGEVEVEDGEKVNPLVQALAARNVALAEHYQSLTTLIKSVELDAKEANSIYTRVFHAAESAGQKVKAIGLTDAIGAMLRKQKLSLPGKKKFLQDINNRSETISSAQLELLEYEEERSRSYEQTIERLDFDASLLFSEFREEANAAIDKRNELLTPLIRAQSEYFDSLVELSSTEQKIANEISDFENFIDELVLWVRSCRPLYSSLSVKRGDFWLSVLVVGGLLVERCLPTFWRACFGTRSRA